MCACNQIEQCPICAPDSLVMLRFTLARRSWVFHAVESQSITDRFAAGDNMLRTYLQTASGLFASLHTAMTTPSCGFIDRLWCN